MNEGHTKQKKLGFLSNRANFNWISRRWAKFKLTQIPIHWSKTTGHFLFQSRATTWRNYRRGKHTSNGEKNNLENMMETWHLWSITASSSLHTDLKFSLAAIFKCFYLISGAQNSFNMKVMCFIYIMTYLLSLFPLHIFAFGFIDTPNFPLQPSVKTCSFGIPSHFWLFHACFLCANWKCEQKQIDGNMLLTPESKVHILTVFCVWLPQGRHIQTIS